MSFGFFINKTKNHFLHFATNYRQNIKNNKSSGDNLVINTNKLNSLQTYL